MKLSEAIEAGWQLVPKIQCEFQHWDYEVRDITGACAIGAACYAARPDETVTCFSAAEKIFPELAAPVRARITGDIFFEGSLGNFVSRLNDNIILDGFDPLDPAPTEADIVAAVRELGY
jgi:hypothetical protein